jgi:hypothetical protein
LRITTVRRWTEPEGGLGVTLLDELKELRRGRGVRSPAPGKVGPILRQLCGITPDDDQFRSKLLEQLEKWAAQLPADLVLAAKAALGLHQEAQQRFLRERTQWLAEQIQRDDRTARRRMDEALELMAQMGTEQLSERPQDEPRPEEYYIAQQCSLVRLHGTVPETYEFWTVVANVDGLADLQTALALPRDPLVRSGVQELDMEVLYGMTVDEQVRDGDYRFRYRLRFPAPLRKGQQHRYAVRYRIPSGQRALPYYVFTTHRRCDAFALRVRFDPDCPPVEVHEVDNRYFYDLNEEPGGARIRPDGAGEISLRFAALVKGMVYGARWTFAPMAGYPAIPDA